MCMLQSYYIKHGTGVEPLVWMTFNTFFSCMIAAACAVGVTIALFCLLAVQVSSHNPILFEIPQQIKNYFISRN